MGAAPNPASVLSFGPTGGPAVPRPLKALSQEVIAENESAVTNLRQTHRAKLRSLEGRIVELEVQLEEETTKRTDNEKVKNEDIEKQFF